MATSLISIAEQDGGHAELYLADRGQLIGCSLVHPACWLVGRTIARGLDAIARGECARPILLPGEDEVSLYGSTLRPGDADLLIPGSAELR